MSKVKFWYPDALYRVSDQDHLYVRTWKVHKGAYCGLCALPSSPNSALIKKYEEKVTRWRLYFQMVILEPLEVKGQAQVQGDDSASLPGHCVE